MLTANGRDTISMSGFVRQQAIDSQQVGYGSAAATLLFLLIAVITALVLTVGRVKLAEDAR